MEPRGKEVDESAQEGQEAFKRTYDEAGRETITIRQIGWIRQAGRGRFRRVQWEDGQVERIDNAPDSFYAFPKDTRFEAMVTRILGSWKIVSMTGVKDIGPLPSPEECKALWDRIMERDMPKAPTVSWDEIL